MYKGSQCPVANPLSQNYFLPQQETGLQRERFRLVRFTFPKELWVADLRNTQKTASQFHSYNDSKNTWKNNNKFTQTGFRKIRVWPGGQGITCGEVYSQSSDNGESVCAHMCVYVQISIYINNRFSPLQACRYDAVLHVHY